ncbi:MAG TPA: hypothetical protein VMM80_10870, partial [Bacteroidota bacterium]|nr:hypothetical protein [Bacteroidota bacterium]
MDARRIRRGRGIALGAIIGVAWILVQPGTAGAYALTAATLQSSGHAAEFTLTAEPGSGMLPHDVFCLDDPWRVVVDLFGADAPCDVKGVEGLATTPVGPVRAMRWSLWKDDPAGTIVRYVIECSGPCAKREEASAEMLRVWIGEEKQAPGAVPQGEA